MMRKAPKRKRWGRCSTSTKSLAEISGRPLSSLAATPQNEEVRFQRSLPVKQKKSIIQITTITSCGERGSGEAKTRSCLKKFTD